LIHPGVDAGADAPVLAGVAGDIDKHVVDGTDQLLMASTSARRLLTYSLTFGLIVKTMPIPS
jgi:hypothetical protein